MESGAVVQFAAHLLAFHGDVMHFALIHITQELGKDDIRVLLRIAALLNHGPQYEGRHANSHPEQYGLHS
jgi:hypothetical protein